MKKWDAANPEKMRESKRKWQAAHQEEHRVASLERYYENRDAFLIRNKAWAKNNPDKVREAGRRHDAKPERKKPRGDVVARQARYKVNHPELVLAQRRAYQAKRRLDPAQRVVDAIRRRIRHVIRGQSKGVFAAFGYTAEELRAHLEARFRPGMTWTNYGLRGEKWHVDHVRPVSSFKLPDEMIQCFALTNLQPLWAKDNLAKARKNGELQFLGKPRH